MILLQSANRKLVNQALEDLPVGYREVLVMRELEDLSYKEIAVGGGHPDRHRDVAPFARPRAAAPGDRAAHEEGILMSMKTESPREPEIARDATYHRAPDALRERVSATREGDGARRARRRRFGAGLGLAASFAAVVVVSWNVALMHGAPPATT